MSHLLASLPLWLTTFLVVVLPTALAMAGPVLVRRRYGLERLSTNNEIAGFKFATVGVIYAVLLAFAVIIVWERFSEAEAAVIQEAGAAATIYRMTPGQDAPSAALRRGLDQYLAIAIGKEWPLMAERRPSAEAANALGELYGAMLALAQAGTQSAPVLIESFHQLDLITEARRTRLHFSHGIMPALLWMVLVTGGTLTIAFTFFFGTQNLRAQMLMTGVLALIVFMGLLVILSIDHPFTGSVSVGSEPLQHVLEDLGGK